MYHIMISVSFRQGGHSLSLFKGIKLLHEIKINYNNYPKIRNILFLKGIKLELNDPIEIPENLFNVLEGMK